MLGVLADLLGGLLGFLGEVLPDSPFASLALDLPEMAHDALGWLNWVVPVGPILAMLGAWAAAMVAWDVARVALRGVVGRAAGLAAVAS